MIECGGSIGADAPGVQPGEGDLLSPPPLQSRLLEGAEKQHAKQMIRDNHYTHTYPGGKTHVISFGAALVVWGKGSNPYIAQFLLGKENKKACVWELQRMWAPDGHEKNLLTRAISAAVRELCRVEKPDILVSYADPNQIGPNGKGHSGGVYRAASWIYTGAPERQKGWDRRPGVGPDLKCDHNNGKCRKKHGDFTPRRHFHGSEDPRTGKCFTSEKHIMEMGFEMTWGLGKYRFVFPISKLAKKKHPR